MAGPTSDISPLSYRGASNNGNNRLQLFKTQVVAELLKTFEEESPLDQFTRVRNITQGKSAIFPFIGNIAGQYHTPGASLTPSSSNQIQAAEKIISVDGQYLAYTWIHNLDELMDSYDLRSAYVQELARALARSQGYRLARLLVRAARTVGPLASGALQGAYKNYGASGAASDSSTGTNNATYNTKLFNATADTSAANLVNCIWNAVQIMDEKNVTDRDRYTIVRPAQYYLLLNSSSTSVGSMGWLNRDIGGGGSTEGAMAPMIAGTKIIKTNYLPNTDFTTENFAAVNPGMGTYAETGNAETYTGNNYNGDFTGTVALVLNKEAVGTVKLLDVTTETEYYAVNQATLLLAKYAQGHGVLRPECACEIAKSTSATAKFLPVG